MFRCEEKRIRWYLNRNLAEKTSENPVTIRLKFTPKGLGNHNRAFGLYEMENRCVNCGSEEYLTRHHVVPFCYRKHFPEKYKNHNCHDVLSLCRECHENYERKADQLKEDLAKTHGVSTNGIVLKYNIVNEIIQHNRITIHESHMRKIISNCNLLLRKDLKSIPESRINEVKQEVRNFLGREYTDHDLSEICKMKPTILQKTHGEVVVGNISDIQSFIEMWRRHFVDNNQCRHMPKNWNIKHRTDE